MTGFINPSMLVMDQNKSIRAGFSQSLGSFAFSTNLYRIRENDPANSQVSIVRTGGVATSATLMVSLTELPGGATAGYDYDPTPIKMTFRPGETNQAVCIPILPDSALETNETVVLGLAFETGTPAGYHLGEPSTATLIIIDDPSRLPKAEIVAGLDISRNILVIKVEGPSGQRYILETSQNLKTWQGILTNQLKYDLEFIEQSISTERAMFYRFKMVP